MYSCGVSRALYLVELVYELNRIPLQASLAASPRIQSASYEHCCVYNSEYKLLPGSTRLLAPLLGDCEVKESTILQSIDLSKGPLPGMDQWRRVFGKGEFDHLLTSHLVPRLATYLRDNFDINPAEQDLAPLEAVFAWKGLISNEVIGELLKAQFFPKFLEIIHD